MISLAPHLNYVQERNTREIRDAETGCGFSLSPDLVYISFFEVMPPKELVVCLP